MTPEPYLYLATILFAIGLVGIVSRSNLFVVYMSVELMLSAVNLALVTFSRVHGTLDGAIMALLMIAVIAAEAAIFLAAIIHLYRSRRTVDSNSYTELAQSETL